MSNVRVPLPDDPADPANPTVPSDPSAISSVGLPRGCPVHPVSDSQRKTARHLEPSCPALARDEAGVWHVRDYAAARALLRHASTAQAGFKADLLRRLPRTMRLPILYQDGKTHQSQRQQTAKFFTPRAVSETYQQLMHDVADEVVTSLQRAGSADVSQLTLTLAVRVAAEVVGLRDSRLPGIDRRLNAFFAAGVVPSRGKVQSLWGFLRTQWHVAAFYLLDVRPAIRQRRRQPQEDVISHLVTQGYGDGEILTECVTFAAAGMITTREFISVAAWHLLEQPALRARYLAGAPSERQRLLQEILRLEPVVGHLQRRATADLRIEVDDAAITIAEGETLDLHIYAINADESAVGDEPLVLRPDRVLGAAHISPAVMSFGDGPHRCPGSSIAIQETDIFLRRLLATPGLRVERPPRLSWNELIGGYELRDFIVTADREARNGGKAAE